jgi:hypothetical protein
MKNIDHTLNALKNAFLLALCLSLFFGSFANSTPLQCDTPLHSKGRDSIEVVTGYQNPTVASGAQVYWHPAPSSAPIDLTIVYLGANLDALGSPSGGHVDISAGIVKPGTANSVSIRILGGESWQFPIHEATFNPYRQKIYQIGFFQGKHMGLISAIGQGKRIEIDVNNDGVLQKRVTFDLSHTRIRDALLASAKSRIVSHDPAVCSMTPVPSENLRHDTMRR